MRMAAVGAMGAMVATGGTTIGGGGLATAMGLGPTSAALSFANKKPAMVRPTPNALAKAPGTKKPRPLRDGSVSRLVVDGLERERERFACAPMVR